MLVFDLLLDPHGRFCFYALWNYGCLLVIALSFIVSV